MPMPLQKLDSSYSGMSSNATVNDASTTAHSSRYGNLAVAQERRVLVVDKIAPSPYIAFDLTCTFGLSYCPAPDII